jgi:hypothetical protein
MKSKLNLTDHLKVKRDKPKQSNWLKITLREYELEHLELCKWLKDRGIVNDLYLRHWPNTEQFLEENKELLDFYYIYTDLTQK